MMRKSQQDIKKSRNYWFFREVIEIVPIFLHFCDNFVDSITEQYNTV